MTTQTYIGKGILYLGPFAGDAARRDVGNVSKLEIAFDEDKKDQPNYRSPGGGNYNTLSRVKAVNVNMTLLELSAENLAVAAFGDTSAVTATAVTDESQVAYVGGLVRTAYMIDTSVAPVVTDATGVTTYVEGTDYNVAAGGAGVVIISGGAIADADAILIDYTKKAGNIVQALTESALEYSLVFDGLNEAESSRPVVIEIYRFKPAPLKTLGVIGDDYANLEIDGESLPDTTIVAAGLSQYFKIALAA